MRPPVVEIALAKGRYVTDVIAWMAMNPIGM
jgi:hypothetical protein